MDISSKKPLFYLLTIVNIIIGLLLPTKVAAYPNYFSHDELRQILSQPGQCHTKSGDNRWWYAQDNTYNQYGITWRALYGKNSDQISHALNNYIDNSPGHFMMVIQMGGVLNNQSGGPDLPFYKISPFSQENEPDTGATPELENSQFQKEASVFLDQYGNGLRKSLEDPTRRSKVLAIIGWLGSYSEAYYNPKGSGNESYPSAEAIKWMMQETYQKVGLKAEIPIVFHVTPLDSIRYMANPSPRPADFAGGPKDTELKALYSPLINEGVKNHQIWFKLNGLSDNPTYMRRQSSFLQELNMLGANVGWEPKSPDTDISSTSWSQSLAIAQNAYPSFTCTTSDKLLPFMAQIIDVNAFGIAGSSLKLPATYPFNTSNNDPSTVNKSTVNNANTVSPQQPSINDSLNDNNNNNAVNLRPYYRVLTPNRTLPESIYTFVPPQYSEELKKLFQSLIDKYKQLINAPETLKT